MSGTISMFHWLRNCSAYLSTRSQLEGRSGLPPLKAAVTRAPGT